MSLEDEGDLRRETEGSGIATLERFRAPIGLCGRTGTHRGKRQFCAIDADDDAKAASEWLADSMNSDGTYLAARSAIEKLLNWAVFERGVAVSSLERDDITAFVDFLGNPWPSSRWVSPRGVRRHDPRWRPFQGAQSERSIVTILSHCRACFNWLRVKGYASLRLLSDAASLRHREIDQDDFAGHDGRTASRPLRREDWAWVEAQLADDEDCTSLEERLALELQFFGGFKLRQMHDLLVEHCIPPTPEIPTWRIHLPCPRLGRTWVFALPPLARTLDHWFGGTLALHRSQFDIGEPVFANLKTSVRGVRRLLERAAARAAAHGSLASAARLERGSSVSLRTTFEHIAGDSFAFLAGLSANAALRSTSVAEYARRIELTSANLEAAWSDLAPFWAGYPTSPDYEVARNRALESLPEARPIPNFKQMLERVARYRLDRPTPPPTAAYRSLDRYLRSHVAPRSNARLARWISEGDPLAIGAEVAASGRAQAAWAYLLWIFTIEPSVQKRRFRMPGSVPAEGNRSVMLNGDALAEACVLKRGEAKAILGSPKRLGDAMLQVWRAALQAAREMAAGRLVHWGPGLLRCDPHGLRPDELHLQERPRQLLLPAPCRSKDERRRLQSEHAKVQLQLLARTFQGPCLTFDGADWTVREAPELRSPVSVEYFERARLLGVKGCPRVVLHQGVGIWTARLVDMALQVVASSKHVCFSLLRDATRKVVLAFPDHWNPVASVESADVLRRVTLLERSRRSDARHRVRRNKFWEAGPSLIAALHEVKRIEADLRTNALPPPTIENE